MPKRADPPPLIGPSPSMVGPHCDGALTVCQSGGGRNCKCAYSWEWRDGVLSKPPELRPLGGACPVAERNGRPCFEAPWQPTRVFRLTAADGTPHGTELCAIARNRTHDEAKRQARDDAMRCELCHRPAGPAPRWALGCAPRELPPDVERWQPHFWTEQGSKTLDSGHICPQCAAIQATAVAEGRSIVVTMTNPPTVSIGERSAPSTSTAELSCT